MGWWPFSKEKPRDWNASLNAIDWEHYREPRNVIPVVGAAMATYVLIKLHRMYLQRISGAAQIRPDFFRRRSLLGRVTSVGDGDNFHLFHTPGGRLAGWEWLRRVPKDRKTLKGRTISVRIAGIDAPEGAHFGRPAQPYSGESLAWLQKYILGKRVRAYIYKRDQYDRVVATVYVRKGIGLLRKDVGFEMVKVGLATTYEAKTGAEFGGPRLEKRYKDAEAQAKAKRIGIWAQKKGFESPREYKTRMVERERVNPRPP